MRTSLGICSQCGAQGTIGTRCEYCGSTIAALHDSHGEGNSMIQSWDAFHLDGFTLVYDNCIGDTDFPSHQVVEGIRTGKQGLIDINGDFVIPCIYDELIAYLDYEICCVDRDSQYGVISFTGETIIPLSECAQDELFDVQFNLIVGEDMIYDVNGNIIAHIPSSERVILLSPSLATTGSHGHGIYSINRGEFILSTEYSVIKMYSDNLFLVSKFTDGATRFGVYNTESNTFSLETKYSSIQYRDNGRYEAKLQNILDNGITEMKTITFCIKENDIYIEKEEQQTFQTGSSNGCMFIVLLGIVIPYSLYLLS